MKSIISLFALCIVVVLSACGNSHEPSNSGLTTRTILVYMSANNSLGQQQYDKYDLNEMVLAARRNDFNGGRLIVYHHAYGSSKPELKEITANGIKILKTYDNTVSSADAKRMDNVLTDMKAMAPAQSYGLILWSHGSGWIQDGIQSNNNVVEKSAPVLYSFGQDIVSPGNDKWMNVTTLADVLDRRGFDFIYFDCCYMAGIEVLYELRHATPFIVASVSELPKDGMPYDKNLPFLFAPQADLVAAARNTFNYYNAQTDYMRTCTMSVVDCSMLDELAERTRVLMSSAKPSTIDSEIQRFTLDRVCYYYDLEDYIRAIASNSSELSNWGVCLNDAVLYKANTPTLWGLLSVDRHCGLSTNIVRNLNESTVNGYNQLSWWRDVVSVMFNKAN